LKINKVLFMTRVSGRRLFIPIALAVALAAAAIAMRGKGRSPDTPEGTVRAFFAAAQDGDAAAYLSLLSGPLKASVQETQSQLGDATYRRQLRDTVSGLKGFAVTRAADSADDRAVLDVELVFADRSERQRFTVVRESRGWSIAAIDRAEAEKPAAPYGSPVYNITPGDDANPEPADSAQRAGP
jgi:hypothetical protein